MSPFSPQPCSMMSLALSSSTEISYVIQDKTKVFYELFVPIFLRVDSRFRYRARKTSSCDLARGSCSHTWPLVFVHHGTSTKPSFLKSSRDSGTVFLLVKSADFKYASIEVAYPFGSSKSSRALPASLSAR